MIETYFTRRYHQQRPVFALRCQPNTGAPCVAAGARPFGLPVSNQNHSLSPELLEKPLEDGKDLRRGTLGPGKRMDDRPIAVLIPTNTDQNVDDLGSHVGRQSRLLQPVERQVEDRLDAAAVC